MISNQELERRQASLDAYRLTKHQTSAVHDGVVLVCGSSLTPTPIAWIWEYWLAQGKLHVLAGAAGQGKTTIALAFTATITSGGHWPDGSRGTQGNVLIWSGEDDPSDTLLPRLIAMGADRNRVFFVTGSRIAGELTSFDPARDLPQLLDEITKIGGIQLLVVDPIVSVVLGDSHKNSEVRRALQPLVDLAASCQCAVLGISHFSKGGQGQDPTQRVVGSIAFGAVARVVMVAAKIKSEDGQDRRILARSKSNIGPDDGGFEYHIEQMEVQPGIQASYIAWGAVVAGTARELLTDPDDQDGDTDAKSKVDSAADFLRQVLAKCALAVKTVEAEAKSAGVSLASVRRAADRLKVIKTKGTDAWYWKLPKLLNQDAQDSYVQKVEHVEHLAQVDRTKLYLTLGIGVQEAQGAQHSDVEHIEQDVEQVEIQGAETDRCVEDAEVF